MITDLNVATLYVSDPHRAVDFFVRLLGFTTRVEVEMAPGRWWRELAPPGGGTAVAVLAAADFDRPAVPGLTFTFHCDDVAATVAALRAAGADVTQPRQEPWGLFAQCTDPDGHVFILGGPKEPTP